MSSNSGRLEVDLRSDVGTHRSFGSNEQFLLFRGILSEVMNLKEPVSSNGVDIQVSSESHPQRRGR